MKDFLKYTLASILGVFLSFALFFMAILVLITIIIASLQTKRIEEIPANTVLEIKLNYIVPERSFQSFRAFTSFPFVAARKQVGLPEIIDNIRKARTDYKVKGIFLNLNNFVGGSIATIEVIRRELLEFKKSKKFIVAFGDFITQKAYYLSTVADKIYIMPEGYLDFRGLSIEVMF